MNAPDYFGTEAMKRWGGVEPCEPINKADWLAAVTAPRWSVADRREHWRAVGAVAPAAVQGDLFA